MATVGIFISWASVAYIQLLHFHFSVSNRGCQSTLQSPSPSIYIEISQWRLCQIRIKGMFAAAAVGTPFQSILLQQRVMRLLERPAIVGTRSNRFFLCLQRGTHKTFPADILPTPSSRRILQGWPSHHPGRQPPRPWQQWEGRTGQPAGSPREAQGEGERGRGEDALWDFNIESTRRIDDGITMTDSNNTANVWWSLFLDFR